MSDKPFSQILSKINNGTIIRHVEKFDNVHILQYKNKDTYSVT